MMQWRRKRRPLETTTQLRECITEALSFLPKAEQKEAIKKSCQRTAQPIRPTAEECVRNSRAKSTKMRWAVRAEE